MKKIVSMIVVSVMAMSLCACTGKADQSASAGGSSVQQSEEFTEQLSTDSAAESEAESTEEPATRIITDSTGRDLEIPSRVESIVCVGVGALRYSCYMDAAGLVVGVEDYEVKEGMSRLYNYVNFDKFKDLPVTGTNGEPNIEEIITAGPQVIVMSSYASADADDLQEKSGIPVVMVSGSDTTLDDNAYETIRIMGELYGKEDRAQELTAYLKGIQKDLDDRTADIPEEDKPSVYVAGVSFKGAHGFEGTEAYYGPFELIHANNLANTTDQTGAFDIDLEQVLTWDPEIIFLDFNGMSLINEDYADNPDYYQNLTAVKEGKVYSQISFRSSASNLETALADAYYAACIMYPEQFSDIDPVEKAGEIFTALLGTNPYEDLKEAGYEFRQITIGE
ncbi:iron ABC transporter substrate-binding protein [Eisenbergiella tayi]|uniref:Fe(3+)-citrate-binding protein YfmC n=1 Tax=Eisenbergiella tayi TaxID=1432052 RepID=A0A1E3AZ15_9FIRM|nr:iron ABC transporter substrate-binding protein [Eisenbergiella tayi]ODM13889.1 Fe(3+)-citrate-binding protein YfmC precursor [Eisenbergiella tayi]OIZ66383.1 iron ABC transporter substrate-binding protein [Eisenbergiella tayi]